MNRTALRVGLVAATVTSAALVVTPDHPVAAAGPDRPYCSLTGMTTYEWDGAGDRTSWSDPDNWAGGVVPATDDLDDAYVCIPAQPDEAPEIVMSAGDVATVQAIDAPLADLVIEDGAGLFVYGDHDTRPSSIGTSGFGSRAVIKIRGALGGPGLIEVDAVTLLGRSGEDSAPGESPTLTSDPCPHLEGLPPAACGGEDGRLVHNLAIFNDGGFDLLAGYDFLVTRVIYSSASIGLGPGSRFELGSTDGSGFGGSLQLYGGDIYPIGDGDPEPVVVNEGSIDKRAESGTLTSTISARYEGEGELVVADGHRLIIGDRTARRAGVTAASAFGSGPCRRVAGRCRFTTLDDPGKRQSAVFRAPRDQVGRTLVRVVARPDLRRPGQLGHPYRVHAGALDATRSASATIQLRYDGSLLRGDTWRDVQVYRQPTYDQPWRRVRRCRADGTPPTGARACVDRRGLRVSSRQVPRSGGDAILVVRTTVTSRWVGHRTRS